MVFNSPEFILFLPIVFCLYWFVFNRLKIQNLFIILASYVFYGWWNTTFLILIALTSFCSYISGIAIQHHLGKKRSTARNICISNIAVNLLILGYFKYYNFFVDSFVSAFSSFGFNLHISTLNIILPVGISFYTFQALSYTIDVYRGKLKATNDILSFFAYICFFPQLVAGPIERATNLLPQFQRKRTFDYALAVEGCRQMLWGAFKKIVIADNCAYYADIAFNNIDECGTSSLILGALFFTFQIYGDFSGYSSIAIGCAKLFGITLKPNFRTPYFSRDIAEFWRRWHISLNKWFTDYVYIPLGGSRVSKAKIARNILVVFLLSGLWHGANWTYICWGAYHAILFMPLILTGNNKKYKDSFCLHTKHIIREIAGMLTTFLLVVVGWIIFRADTITSAMKYFQGILSFRPNGNIWVSIKDTEWLILAIVFTLFVEWKNRQLENDFQFLPSQKILRYSIYMLLTAIIYITFMISINDDKTFIYFQF